MRKFCGLLLLVLLCCCAMAQQYAVDKAPATNNPTTELISVDKAFQFSAAARDYQTILARWKIASGYYLYRARFHFRLLKPEDARLARPLLPEGMNKTSPGVGMYQVYSGTVNIPIPVISPQGEKVVLEVSYQGCAKVGYCYPPTTKVVPIDLSQNYMVYNKGLIIDVPITPEPVKTTSTKLSKVQQLLKGDNLWALIIGFLGFGILISFTPCVLPMIPILSSIITGQKKITTAHAFLLSVSYVLGMAITYAVAGAIVGLVGGSIQAALQIPWVIILFSLLFVTMALSLFGFYSIELPQRWRRKMAHASEHQKRGTYFGVFIMGILSSLILSPCVTPPLVGVLGYIGQTGNATLGGLALFIMAIGMGLPLLIIGFSHGKLIPKAGPWMNKIKNWMGILMLALAIWMLQRILSSMPIMLLWATLAIGTSIYMGALSSVKTKWAIVSKALGIIVFVYGILLAIGGVTGHYNPLRPLQFTKGCAKEQALTFKEVHTVSDVENAVEEAKRQGKPVLLDFWAQWCISCKEMDNFTFSNADVQKRLANFVLLRADVTKNDSQTKALEHYFNVVAPPTVLFFKNGKELRTARIIGEMGVEDFLAHIKHITNSTVNP